jgi:hypothetical protein
LFRALSAAAHVEDVLAVLMDVLAMAETEGEGVPLRFVRDA